MIPFPCSRLRLAVSAAILGLAVPPAASQESAPAPSPAGTARAAGTAVSAPPAEPPDPTGPRPDSAIALDKQVVKGKARPLTRKESDQVARMPLRYLENPQSYSLVPKELLRQQIAVDYNSAYKNLPGVSKGVQWMQGHSAFYTRGFSSSTEVRNGLSVNAVTDADLANVERIEAIRGPAGALFGSGSGISYGGLFNTVTKAPSESFKGSVSASGGSWNLGRAAADVNAPLNAEKTLLLRVNAARHNEGSFMDQGFTDSWTAAPTLAYKASDRLKLTLDLEMYRRAGTSILSMSVYEGVSARSVEDLGIGYRRSFLNNSLKTESRTTNMFARADYRISEDWSSETVLASTNSQSDLFSIYLGISNDSTARRWFDNQAWKVNTRQFQQNFRGVLSKGPVRNQVLAGFGVRAFDYLWPYTVSSDTINYRTLEPEYHMGLERYRARLAGQPMSMWTAENYTYYAYASDAVHLGDRFTALFGIRWDRFDDRGGGDGLSEPSGRFEQDAFSPKLGVVYRPVKDRLSVYASYASGFKNVGGRSESGEAFAPEQARQGELGAKVQAPGGMLTGTVALYAIQVEDVVRGDPSNPGFSIQDGTQNSMGVEVDVASEPLEGLSLTAGYAWNRSEMTKADADVEGRRPASSGPELAFNFWAGYELPAGPAKGLGAGVGGNYASRAYSVNTRTFVFTVPSYFLLDATLFYDRPAYRLGLKVDNIMNRKYWSPEYLQAGAPRRLIGDVTYKF